jgi:hypothetical protein
MAIFTVFTYNVYLYDWCLSFSILIVLYFIYCSYQCFYETTKRWGMNVFHIWYIVHLFHLNGVTDLANIWSNFEFITKEEEECDFYIYLIWGKRACLEWILVLLKYKIWKKCCAVPQYYEFGCQTPDSPSIVIKNIKPDNDQY